MKMFRFAVIFLLVMMVLFRIDMLDSVQSTVISPWTNLLATMSAYLMTLFDSDVVSFGRVIQSKTTGFGVSIEAGCNGVEAAIVLIAGMLAFPAPWRMKIVGILIGIAAVQVANLLRVISLYYLGKWNTQIFEFAHLYLWQALIMLDVLIVWLLWMRSVARQQRPIELKNV
jgi:exosortase H (IPTLxxWG-CTERM-specific)